MSWQRLFAEERVQTHRTSLREIGDLRAVVQRDLRDAALPGLSSDRRFATAYNAALQTSKMAIACAGYRVVGTAHHQTTFEALEVAMGPTIASTAAFLETCRRKRNTVDYDMASVVSDTEAADLLAQATNLLQSVEEWIASNHPQLALPAPAPEPK